MVMAAVIIDGITIEYGSEEPRSLRICMAIMGKIGAKAMFTTAKVHMSLLAIGLCLLSSSSFSMVRRANTVELLPAPNIFAIKLIIMEDNVSGSL